MGDETTQEETVPVRETDQELRDRHDAEIAEENKARQVRQGVIPDESESDASAETEEVVETEETPKVSNPKRK